MSLILKNKHIRFLDVIIKKIIQIRVIKSFYLHSLNLNLNLIVLHLIIIINKIKLNKNKIPKLYLINPLIKYQKIRLTTKNINLIHIKMININWIWKILLENQASNLKIKLLETRLIFKLFNINFQWNPKKSSTCEIKLGEK